MVHPTHPYLAHGPFDHRPGLVPWSIILGPGCFVLPRVFVMTQDYLAVSGGHFEWTRDMFLDINIDLAQSGCIIYHPDRNFKEILNLAMKIEKFNQ